MEKPELFDEAVDFLKEEPFMRDIEQLLTRDCREPGNVLSFCVCSSRLCDSQRICGFVGDVHSMRLPRIHLQIPFERAYTSWF